MDQKLTLYQKMGWGLADMGVVVFVIVKQLLVLSFLTNYLGVNVALAGVITTSILVFDIALIQSSGICRTVPILDGADVLHGW